jgi:tetratricopeptide (TPR) repeat protein
VSPGGGLALRASTVACRLAHTTGRFYLVRQQYERALPYLEQGVGCETGQAADRWAWFDLARAELALGDLPAAARSLANADGYDYVAGLARQAAAEQDRARQIELWHLAIQVDPGQQVAYLRLAALYGESEPDRAEALFQQAIAGNPRDGVAYLALAKHYTRYGQLEAAGQVLTTALAYLPKDVAVLQAIAANAGARGQISQAVDFYQQVAALSDAEGQRAAAYFAIGELTATDSNLASALTFFRLAVASDPDKPTYLLALGQTYQAQGCPDQASQLYQQLLSLSPDASAVAAAEAGLAELAGQTADPGVGCPPLP